MRTAAQNSDPFDRVYALASLVNSQEQKGQKREAEANRQEALKYGLALPAGHSRYEAEKYLIALFREAWNVPVLLRLGDASKAPELRRHAYQVAIYCLWDQATTSTALTLAAQVKQIAGKFADAFDRREAFRNAVILREWGGDTEGAKRLAAQTLDKQNPAAFLLIGDRLRHARTPQEAQRWRKLMPYATEQDGPGAVYTEPHEDPSEPIVEDAPPFSEIVDEMLAAGDRRDALVFADGVSGAGYRLKAYRKIARAAAKEKILLQALVTRAEPLLHTIKTVQDRAENYLAFADAYAAAGRASPVLREAEAVPDAAARALLLAHWGQWQARSDPKSARKTLWEAETAAAQIETWAERIPARMEIVAGFMEAGAKPDAVPLLNKTAQEFSRLPERPDSDTLRESLANGQAAVGDAVKAAQTAGEIKSERGRTEALILLALRFHHAGKWNALPPFLSALPDADARAELLWRLISAQTGAIGPPQKQRYLAFATTNRAKMNVLLAIAREQAGSKNAAEAHRAVNEALPLLANMPPGPPRLDAQLRAAWLLHRLGADGELRSLLAALEEQSARVLPAGKPAEPLRYGERDAEAELLLIAQMQSKTGDLGASLQTLRLLPPSTWREGRLRDAVTGWLRSAPRRHDLTLLTTLTRPDERPYALLTAANLLLPEWGGVTP